MGMHATTRTTVPIAPALSPTRTRKPSALHRKAWSQEQRQAPILLLSDFSAFSRAQLRAGNICCYSIKTGHELRRRLFVEFNLEVLLTSTGSRISLLPVEGQLSIEMP